MNPRLGLARHLIVYAFMQQCDDVETIYQSVLKTSLEKKRRPKKIEAQIILVVKNLHLFSMAIV